ncbi:DNA translocase FtsK 4TM domain-containing protein [Salipiger sp. P9]|uniref:DNA translocase FtsK n=1 Tax=Salipiger pentaromativorans TaxID=2943193 RepID=UPI0021573A7D|nr:DNA translocase FtsK 4TM domain-containing protein [Salipiger pentaromativorans]MCR8547948.1 DNA translocase FtsK 4TM domain-containing protein [Salipiger pentaromativorans]
MAYQARGRDPLFDSNMQAAIEKRGKELGGLALVALGLMAAAMIGSYTPDDPSWLSATDAPVQNWMGRMGASIAAPLFMIVGWGSWGLALVLLVWGVRLALHRGEERALSRVVFAPIWIALSAVYAAGQPVGPEWTHSFGLGGLFGDMMMGSVLGILPLGAGLGLKLAMIVLGVGIVTMGAFVLGFTRIELNAIARFLLVGVVMVYATLLTLLGRGASASVAAAQHMQAAQAARRERRQQEAAEAAAWAAAQEAVPSPSLVRRPPAAAPAAAPMATQPVAPRVMTATPAPAPDYDEGYAGFVEAEPAPEPKKQGLLARVPGLIKRPEPMPEPELVEPAEMDHDVEQPGEERIRAKIADVIRARRPEPASEAAPAFVPDPSKPLTKGRGRGPDPLIYQPAPAVRREPPVSAAHPHPHSLPPEPPLSAPRAAVAAAPVAAPAAPAPALAPEPVLSAPAPAPQPETARVAAPMPVVPPAPAPLSEALQAEDAVTDDYDDFADYRDFDDYGDEDDHIPAMPAHVERTAIPIAQPKKVVQQPQRKPMQPSRRAQAEAQPQLSFDEGHSEYELPPLSLLASPDAIERHHLSDEALEENARMLETVLDDYGVKGEIVSVRPGPVVTMYELEPAPGLKASRVIGLADDIARSMSALSARVSTVPGRSVIGIELPNENREMVSFREILSSRDYGDGNQKLPLALGKDIGGDAMVANLAKMPHLLIAGTTGSGKSVAINTMILSLLYKLTPDDLRLVMIDPKMLELSVYDGIPHLLSPVVTDPKKAVVALKWVVGEMEDRYRKMSKMGVRNIDGYNGRVAEALKKGELFKRTVQTGFDDETGEPVFETEEFEPKKMPYIVVIVDEMADLMMVAGKEIEACIQRLAQMARASGIHIIMATQRPSVDVITGTIKANFPTRISFQVTSKIDSRTILGEMGAEQLLGMGDMLYMAGGAKITRCHGPFVSDEEVEEVVNHLKAFGPPDYVAGVVQGPDDDKAENIDAVLGLNTGGNTGGEDALYDQAVAIVIKDRKCSTSYIQRKLGIGYNKAARLVEQMEDEGVVSPANHVGKREILVPEQA